jgi:ubiquinone/menaquinone biosynthesis C-methylase UbiE
MATSFPADWSWYEHYVVPITSKCYEAFAPYLQFEDAPITIFDAGCGVGAGLAIIKKWFHPDSRLVGIDIDTQAVAESASLNLPNTSVVVGDLEQLEMPDSECDRYVSCSILAWVKHPSKVVAEAFRVLQPGGLAGFCVFAPRERCQWMSMKATFHERATIEDHDLKTCLVNMFQCSSQEILTSLATQAGFELVHFFELQLPVLTPNYEAACFRDPHIAEVLKNPRNAEILSEELAKLRQESELPTVGFIFLIVRKPS